MTALQQSADQVDASTVGVVDGDGDGDDRDGRQLSVAEIQQALRELRARRPRSVAGGTATPARIHAERVSGVPGRVPAGSRVRGDTGRTAGPARGDIGGERRAGRGDSAPRYVGSRGDGVPAVALGRGEGGELAFDWVTVVAAHAGAGASTVALALSDAAAAEDLRVHLVDSAPPSRSGLVAAASAELGTDATGAWRRGSRAHVTVYRRAAEVAPGAWPALPVDEAPAVTVLDLGLPSRADLARLATGRTRIVVVCRPTVPGVRLTEQVLSRLAEQPVVVAVVGPRRWPGEVTSSLGPRLRAARAAARVVTVPTDRRLEVTGPTQSPLPKPVRAAARALLRLLADADSRVPAVPASSAPARNGARR